MAKGDYRESRVEQVVAPLGRRVPIERQVIRGGWRLRLLQYELLPHLRFPEGASTTHLETGGTIYAGGAVAQQAQSDVTTAYDTWENLPFTTDLTGQDLGGLTLFSGVYHFDSSAQLTGTLTLDGQGNNNAFWVFQIGSTLTTASSSVVNVINGGPDNGLYWQVGNSATLGTSTVFAGNILALASITLNTTATIPCGRALAQNGAVTMDTNDISIDCGIGSAGSGGAGGFDGGINGGTAIPEPSSYALVASVLGACLLSRKFRRTKNT